MKTREKLFSEYEKLLKKNGGTYFFELSREKAQETFDEKFLKTLIFSEHKKYILNKHKIQIEKELSKIYPPSLMDRDRIRAHCGGLTNINIKLEYNELDIYISGVQTVRHT